MTDMTDMTDAAMVGFYGDPCDWYEVMIMKKIVWHQNQFGTWYATTRPQTFWEMVMRWLKGN